MIRILILGHTGMIGSTAATYFEQINTYKVITLNTRWGDPLFRENILTLDPNLIINCIGAIPQKNPSEDEYRKLNIELPIFLETLSIPVIHPATDCEFSGELPTPLLYTKVSTRDATDAYGKSKAEIAALIETSFIHTKMIRASVIGHEMGSKAGLLEWFLHSTGSVYGYTNHYWNGITTLQWAKLCDEIIKNWDTQPILNQYATESSLTKYNVLETIKKVYDKDIIVDALETEGSINKCLESDTKLPTLKEQLEILRTFSKK